MRRNRSNIVLLCGVLAILAGCATSRDLEQIACRDVKPAATERRDFSSQTRHWPADNLQCSGATFVLRGHRLAEARLDYMSNALIIQLKGTHDRLTMIGFNPATPFDPLPMTGSSLAT